MYVHLVGVFERHLQERWKRKISKFCTLNFLLPTTCFGHSLDHQWVQNLQVQKEKNFIFFILVSFILDDGQTHDRNIL